MRDQLGQGSILGYCTNVHAGATLDETLTNLRMHALKVKAIVSPDQPLGVGLWLSSQAALQLIAQQRIGELREFLDEHGLIAYTLNGFPHGNFHEPVVKHRVYQPTWADAERYRYTLDLVHILSELLPEGAEGSISTLPIGWRTTTSPAQVQAASEQLVNLVHQLARVELDTGRYIHIDLEPEPGCVLDTSNDVVKFFNTHLLRNSDEVSVRAYLRVCHDVCHAAVMFEDQELALRNYQAAGIGVGKVQISSAVQTRFDRMNDQQRAQALEQLRSFDERRYLHQTCIKTAPGSAGRAFYEDLSDALQQEPRGTWRTHFHVPLFLEHFGLLETTQADVVKCLSLLARDDSEVKHFEVETYAWSVLPEQLRQQSLAQDIAQELIWVKQQAADLAKR